MKWIILGLGALCALVGITAAKSRRNSASTDDEDGGVRHYSSGENAPKVVESTEIIKFKCTASTLSFIEECDLKSDFYEFEAVLMNGRVRCRLKCRICTENERIFDADIGFMDELFAITEKYDLAKHNGYSYAVSGLPDMFGALIDIEFSSGEHIYAYNNQHMFLEREVLTDLFKLFKNYRTEEI